MPAEIKVVGNLAHEPEVRVIRGREVAVLKIASQRDKATDWYTGTIWEPNLAKFALTLEKGAWITVHGLVSKIGTYKVGETVYPSVDLFINQMGINARSER